jgi:hypothetical protein
VKLLHRIAPFLVLAAALAAAHAEIFWTGAREAVPLAVDPLSQSAYDVGVADVMYESWLVDRHARTWPTPWRLFDTPHCAPAEKTLTLGLPMFGLGLLGMPAALFTREPLLVYNWALVAWSAVAALAMYALVAGWTGSRVAGVFSALLFAFHPLRLDHVMHPTEWDIAWTVLALYFAERLCAEGRWRDAILLGVSGALQVATSFYPLLAAAFLAPPIGVWLAFRRVPFRAKPAQIAVAVAIVALAVALVLGPYLAARGSERITARTSFIFLPWFGYLPGSTFFPGWLLLLAAVFGAAVPRRFTLARVGGDPRVALLCAALLVAVMAAGSTTAWSLQQAGLPVPAFDPYTALARVLPGLDAIRVVWRMSAAIHAMVCVLAGAGAAAAIALAGRHARMAGAALCAAAWLASFGWRLPLHWQLEPVRPPQQSIDFFAELATQGNDGPLLEAPVDYTGGTNILGASARILLQAWHGRRTSSCYGSYIEPAREHLAELAAALPGRDAARELRALGFTTVVLHHPQGLLRSLARIRPFEVAAAEPDPPVRFLHRIENMSAYALAADVK